MSGSQYVNFGWKNLAYLPFLPISVRLPLMLQAPHEKQQALHSLVLDAMDRHEVPGVDCVVGHSLFC